MAATEAANTIDLSKVQQIEIKKRSEVHLAKVPDHMPLVRMGTTALHLTSIWIASMFLKSSFGNLMLVPTAATLSSLGMWLSIQPDEDEIGAVMAGWLTVTDELDHVSALGRMGSDGDPLPRTVWDDDARNAFDTWASNFQNEVAQAARISRQFIATFNTFATSLSVTAVAFQAIDYGTKMHQLSGRGAFHELQINNDPNQPYGTDYVNDTFTGLDIDRLT
ncbi:hypothetical protein [Actinopolymorpha pittospori]|uniref:Uncharacterized protein n=1 Tax=Actinopolymorpha pittospori TaxID=648752 RepID=A0A927N1Z3_9ACTN|nr:hypothetical protein [Actinopolymorpha pittospori]MBE1609473.1 hypothetical protein [Actinopolymorpha pittospori]